MVRLATHTCCGKEKQKRKKTYIQIKKGATWFWTHDNVKCLAKKYNNFFLENWWKLGQHIVWIFINRLIIHNEVCKKVKQYPSMNHLYFKGYLNDILQVKWVVFLFVYFLLATFHMFLGSFIPNHNQWNTIMALTLSVI